MDVGTLGVLLLVASLGWGGCNWQYTLQAHDITAVICHDLLLKGPFKEKRPWE